MVLTFVSVAVRKSRLAFSVRLVVLPLTLVHFPIGIDIFPHSVSLVVDKVSFAMAVSLTDLVT